MLGNIRDITTVIVAGLIMLVALLVFFMMTLKGSELSAENFMIGSQNFMECSENYQANQQLYQNYPDSQVISMDVNNLAAMRKQLDLPETCNTDFVVSSDEQISGYASDVYQYLEQKYPDLQFGLLDTVYTAPAKYYAYLEVPQDYLFFAMSSDESKMMAYVYKPQNDAYQITELWSIEQSSNLEVVQANTNNMLVKYYQKVS